MPLTSSPSSQEQRVIDLVHREPGHAAEAAKPNERRRAICRAFATGYLHKKRRRRYPTPPTAAIIAIRIIFLLRRMSAADSVARLFSLLTTPRSSGVTHAEFPRHALMRPPAAQSFYYTLSSLGIATTIPQRVHGLHFQHKRSKSRPPACAKCCQRSSARLMFRRQLLHAV
jgi:hypothetical protein